MQHRRSLAISVLFLSCLVATAKDKKKALLPPDVLRAHTVLVLADPNAQIVRTTLPKGRPSTGVTTSRGDRRNVHHVRSNSLWDELYRLRSVCHRPLPVTVRYRGRFQNAVRDYDNDVNHRADHFWLTTIRELANRVCEVCYVLGLVCCETRFI
jgi:hypothetical protein